MSRPDTLLSPHRPTGLLLCGMGGPARAEDVAPFLRRLFADPRVLPVPRPLAPLLGWWLARRQAPGARERYRACDPAGGSPQLSWTRQQGDRLEALLSARGLAVVAEPAMRYWQPLPQEAVATAIGRGAEQLLLLPLYPQYADATTGSLLDAVRTAARDLCPSLPVHGVREWHLLPGYIAALARRAADLLRPWARQDVAPQTCALLLSAHSLPHRFVERGDPYPDQVRATVRAVHTALQTTAAAEGWLDWLHRIHGGERTLLAYQGQTGPLRWLGPDVRDVAADLVATGCRHLAVQPLSFTCEHVETMYELDRELQAQVLAAGGDEFVRGPALGLDRTWLHSLAEHLATTSFAREEVGYA